MVTTQIKNNTRKTLVASNYRLCKSVSSKARGLMFRNESYVCKNALLFDFDSPGRQSLHMFFVFYSIDVLFLDVDKRVIDEKQNFKPFTIYNSGKPSKYVIELPFGSIKASRTVIGDVLKW